MNQFVGPPAVLVTVDQKLATYEATDESWRAELTRAKWNECDKPDALYLTAVDARAA